MAFKDILKLGFSPITDLLDINPPHYVGQLTYNDLINAESELGRTLFGPIPEGHQREFFESKKNVWIWYESWPGDDGKMKSTTVRYEVRPNGVYKKPNDGFYQKIEGAELDNFAAAVRAYFDLAKRKLYC